MADLVKDKTQSLKHEFFHDDKLEVPKAPLPSSSSKDAPAQLALMDSPEVPTQAHFATAYFRSRDAIVLESFDVSDSSLEQVLIEIIPLLNLLVCNITGPL